MPVSPLVVLSLISGVLCIASGWLVRRRWPKPGAVWFQVGAAASAVWSIGYGFGLLVYDPELRQLFEVPIWLGHGIAPVAFFLFVAAYTGRRAILDRPVVVGLFVVPAITLVAVLTNGEHALMWTDYRIDPAFGAATVSYEKQPWLYVHKAYSYAVLLAAGAILLEVIVDRDALYTVQAIMLVSVVVSLGAGSVVWVLGVGPYPQVTTTPLLFGWVFATAAAVFFRAPLFDSPPAARRLGRERLLEEFGDGVVVVDEEDRIVEANPAARQLLAAGDGEALVGRSLAAIETGTASEDDPASLDLPEGRHRVVLQTTTGRQPFEITVSPVRDETGAALGRTLIFQDVSEETRRRQQLSVLNRVLRHNLRNDMTVVRAYGEELADVEDESRASMAETIVEEADGLLSLGEQARTIEEALSDPDREPQSVDLLELVEDVVAPYRDRAEIAVDVPADLEPESDPRSLSAVLTAAVDNAVEHGSTSPDSQAREDAVEHGQAEGDGRAEAASGEDPRVRVSAAGEDGWVTIAVSDDGPGIPEHELDPIDAGTETDLEHGSGLGLWLITWGAGALGGEVSFENGAASDAADDRGGTTVELRLPRSDAAA